jgi:hypothetical protein
MNLNVKSENSTEKTEMTENIQKYPDVNRVEVISSEGEEFVWDVWEECSKVQVSIHNDGKTLKVFLTGNIK